MEAIGDQLAEFSASGAALPRVLPRNKHLHNVYDGGTRPGRPGRFHAVPATALPTDALPNTALPKNTVPGNAASIDGSPDDGRPVGQLPGAPLLRVRVPGYATHPSGTGGPPGLREVGGLLGAAAIAARDGLASADYVETADFAAQVEDLARTLDYLQVIAAGAVDRTRTQAITAASAAAAGRRASTSSAGPARSGHGWVTGWNAHGVETLNETDTNWPAPAQPPAVTSPVVTSPVDDGCRNTAEFLRLRLRIPIREARRRLALAHHILPGTTLTGEHTPPAREHLATAITPTSNAAGTGTVPDLGMGVDAHHLTLPAVSSYAATIITATLDRLQHHTTTETLTRMEHHLTTTAATTDPDFLTRLAQRWTESIDADGTEPTEEALRHTQGAFIRKPRHGLHHLEIFATTDQYEHLLTVMNTATNPRTTTHDPHHATTQDLHREITVDLDRRTRPQQQLDGLMNAIRAGLTTNTLPTTGGNRPQIIATINYHHLFPHTPGGHTGPGTSSGSGNVTEAGTGTGNFVFTGPVNATTLRKIACDADIIPAVLGTDGEILDLGRKTRLFTPAQRQALTARDQGCTFPNCTIPAPWCEAHHITYWSHGGHSKPTNGALLCSHHHHLIHKEQWTITIQNGVPWYTPPPHVDPTQKPQQNHYFKPPPPPIQTHEH